ncbi:Molybdopterin synthase sulfur carrier subunit [Holothuria leucospilota]|uniref:Molybdopterin synthase sulfur carrier subunit n=1 Tax=Holothuria leucospilota TaxID=206669 RepID=A0A9Q1H2B9_HOLLE|nr:Molybdopterin synthase sulfur carrier subunit [Holothuria leucospilota]
MQRQSLVEVRVLYFAKSRDLAGTAEEIIKVPDRVTSQLLLEIITDRHIELKTIQQNLILAVNQDYISEESGEIQLSTGDEIAVIPPLSGG